MKILLKKFWTDYTISLIVSHNSKWVKIRKNVWFVAAKIIDLLDALNIKPENVAATILSENIIWTWQKWVDMATVSREKSILLKQFNETRARTLSLVQTLEKDDFVVQTAPFMSPPKWHLVHVSWWLEVVMSKTVNDYEFYSQEFSEYLN